MSQSAFASIPDDAVAPPLRSGIRVLVIEKNPDVRERLAAVFAKESAFVFVAAADSLFRAVRCLDEYIPEVVLCCGEHFASASLLQYDGLLLETTWRDGEVVLRAPGGDHFSLSHAHVARSLAEIETEVLSRKREWLRYLLSSAALAESQETGVQGNQNPSPIRLRLEDFVWVRAQRNYAVLHSSTGTWKQRGSLITIQSNLPAGKFLRISRSCAVNRTQIQSAFKKDNSLAITMICGTVLRPSRSYLRAVIQAIPELVECRPGKRNEIR